MSADYNMDCPVCGGQNTLGIVSEVDVDEEEISVNASACCGKCKNSWQVVAREPISLQ